MSSVGLYYYPILSTFVTILVFILPQYWRYMYDPMLECIETNIGNGLTSVGLCTCPMLQTCCPVVGVCLYQTLEMFHPVLDNSVLQLLKQFSNIGLHNSPILENYLPMLECRATNAGNDLPVLVNFIVLCWNIPTLGDITIYQCWKICHVYQ